MKLWGHVITQLHLKADHIGDLWGLSTQFSDDGFAGMGFSVRVKSKEDFESWVDEARKSACDLDRAGYAALRPESRNVRAFAFRSVAPSLFSEIVRRVPMQKASESAGAVVPCPEATR